MNAPGGQRDLLSRHQRISHADGIIASPDDLSASLGETTTAEGPLSTAATGAEVPSPPSLSGALTLPHQHGYDARPQLLGNEAALFQPVSSLALHNAAAGFPDLCYQDSLSQDLLAGMDGIDFDFLLDDTQLSNSFLLASPVNAGSPIMAIPPTDQVEAPSSIQPEHGRSFAAQTHQAQRPRQVHCLRPWKIEADEYSKILDEAQQLRSELPSSFKLPSHRALSRFLEGYFRGFAVHLPFIHGVTFSAPAIGLELLLSLAAVGALYRFETASGYQIYAAARHLISWHLKQRTQPTLDRLTHDDRVTIDDDPSAPATPASASPHTRESELHAQGKTIRLLQAMIILMAMASWGDRELTSDALSMSSQVAMLAREMKIHELEKPPPVNQQWAEGIKLEERRRTLFAAFALLNLQSVAFDVPPLLLNREVAINLPGCASSWQAPNAEEWSALSDTYMPPRPFPEKMHMLLAGRSIHTVTALSSFGNYVLINGLLQQILLTRNACEHLPIVGGDSSLGGDFINKMEAALRAWQQSWEATYESTTDPSSPKGPLGFNSTALLRLAYIRLNVGHNLDQRLLARDDAPGIAAALSSQIITAGDRSPHMNQAVLQCIYALSIPVRVGVAFVARTQTLNWSIQHALANLECAFLLTKWLKILSEVVQESGSDSLQPDERRLIQLVIGLVQETELGDQLDKDERLAVQINSLSSLTLTLWSKTFNGSHVFDVVRVIGDGLSILAHASKKGDVVRAVPCAQIRDDSRPRS
ncbi:AmdA [Colletotrichum filicis]|nr:AmdA [Colletotrichum filicis]